jgi:hypothetical protein
LRQFSQHGVTAVTGRRKGAQFETDRPQRTALHCELEPGILIRRSDNMASVRTVAEVLAVENAHGIADIEPTLMFQQRG